MKLNERQGQDMLNVAWGNHSTAWIGYITTVRMFFCPPTYVGFLIQLELISFDVFLIMYYALNNQIGYHD
jgi:hypothetical protein